MFTSFVELQGWGEGVRETTAGRGLGRGRRGGGGDIKNGTMKSTRGFTHVLYVT